MSEVCRGTKRRESVFQHALGHRATYRRAGQGQPVGLTIRENNSSSERERNEDIVTLLQYLVALAVLDDNWVQLANLY